MSASSEPSGKPRLGLPSPQAEEGGAAAPSSSTPVRREEKEEDLYGRFKALRRKLEFLKIREDCVKNEQKNLKQELRWAQEEIKRLQSVPLVVGNFLELIDQNSAIVVSSRRSTRYVRILSAVNRELLKPSMSVALHRHSNALVDVLPPEAHSSISLLSPSEKPDVTYNVSLQRFCQLPLALVPIVFASPFRFSVWGSVILLCSGCLLGDRLLR